MNTVYSIWTDWYFYVYLVIAISSAIILVSSIRKLMEYSKISDEIEKGFAEVDDKTDDKIEETLENQDIVSTMGGDNVSETEKLEFKDEETIFDVPVKNEETQHQDTQTPAVRFIIELNEKLGKILNKLDNIDSLNKNIQTLENEVKTLKENISEIIKNQDGLLFSVDKVSLTSEKDSMNTDIPVPKYVSKYLQDILDDYDNLDDSVIRKRIEVIIKDLNNMVDG